MAFASHSTDELKGIVFLVVGRVSLKVVRGLFVLSTRVIDIAQLGVAIRCSLAPRGLKLRVVGRVERVTIG